MILLLAILLQDPEAAATPGPTASARRVAARLDLWLAEPGGTADVGRIPLFGSPTGGDEVDLRSDLGLDGAEPFLLFRFGGEGAGDAASGRRDRIEFVYGKAEWSGAGTLNREVEFDGTLYPAGTDVDGEFWIQYWGLDGAVEWSFGEGGAFGAGLLLGLDLVRARTRMESADHESHLTNGDLLAAFGGTFRWSPAPWLDVGASGRFGFGSLGSILFDGVVSAGVRVSSVHLEVGWRIWRFWDELDDFEVDFQLRGFFASLAVRL